MTDRDRNRIMIRSPSVSVKLEEARRFLEKHVSKGGVKMELEYVMTDKETGELRTTAKSSHCFLNRSGKPISLKRAYPELDTKFFEMKEDME